jgi:hypothetical protein
MSSVTMGEFSPGNKIRIPKCNLNHKSSPNSSIFPPFSKRIKTKNRSTSSVERFLETCAPKRSHLELYDFGSNQ